MNIGELNSLINDNVYENTEQAITGGKLQTVLQGMMGALMGTSKINTSLSSNDVRKIVGQNVAAYVATSSGFGSSLAYNSELATGLAQNSNFTSPLISKLATDAQLATGIATNYSFWTANMTNWAVSYIGANTYLGTTLATNAYLVTKMAEVSTGSLGSALVNSSAFISALKSALGI